MTSRRHKAREVTLQMLYQKDLNPDVTSDEIKEQIQSSLADEQLGQFAWVLFTGVTESRNMIDEQLEAIASNWSVSRMPALELAKTFGGQNSVAFVNGILDRLIPAEKRVVRLEIAAMNSSMAIDQNPSLGQTS